MWTYWLQLGVCFHRHKPPSVLQYGQASSIGVCMNRPREMSVQIWSTYSISGCSFSFSLMLPDAMMFPVSASLCHPQQECIISLQFCTMARQANLPVRGHRKWHKGGKPNDCHDLSHRRASWTSTTPVRDCEAPRAKGMQPPLVCQARTGRRISRCAGI